MAKENLVAVFAFLRTDPQQGGPLAKRSLSLPVPGGKKKKRLRFKGLSHPSPTPGSHEVP